MELSIKHLAPYLPFGLKMQYKNKAIELLGIKNNTPWSMQLSVQISKDMWTYGYEIKPILRPIEDLTRKIEFNGKNVFPVEIILDYYGYEIITNKERMVEPAMMLPYGVFNLLLEMHFDVFGLIEKDLAISINKLNLIK